MGDAPLRFGSTRWARLVVALVNTAPGSRHDDLLRAPGDLRRLLLDHGEPEPVTVRRRDLDDALVAREELAAVFAAVDDRELARRLNAMLERAAHPRLVLHRGLPLHMHVDAPSSSYGEWLAASGAFALALLVAEHGSDILGHCAAADCHHAILQVGSGRPRRFCDERCATRTRVAAHRRQRRLSR